MLLLLIVSWAMFLCTVRASEPERAERKEACPMTFYTSIQTLVEDTAQTFFL